MPNQVPPSLFSNPLRYLKYLVTPYDDNDRASFKRKGEYMSTGAGYFHEQSTKPQTLGYSLSGSPVGLLAWIYEKLVIWTDSYSWKDDEGEDSMPFADETH